MTTVIKNMNDLKKHVNLACSKAVKNACNRLLGTLQQLIDTEFYDVFIPDFYHRTYQFWESATTEMTKQKNINSGKHLLSFVKNMLLIF